MTFDDLIERAGRLKDVDHKAPAVKIWKKDVRDIVERAYGVDYRKILDDVLRFPRVISPMNPARPMHVAAMDRAIAFLTEMRDKEPGHGPSTTAATVAAATPDLLAHLDSRVQAACKTLFESGQYAEAAEKGFKLVRDRLRQLTGRETGSEAFGKGNLHVRGAAAPHVEKDFNEGVRFFDDGDRPLPKREEPCGRRKPE